MLKWIASRLGRTVMLSVARESFTFATSARTVIIEAAMQVAADGRILGFGRDDAPPGARIVELFPAGGADPDERALVGLCRRGLSLVLGPLSVRPRVVIHGGSSLGGS